MTIDKDINKDNAHNIFLKSNFSGTKIGTKKELEKLFKVVKECRKNKRMAVVPIGLVRGKSGHQNLLIYNYITDTWEHYEPQGKSMYKSGKNLNENFEKTFSKSITENTKYISPEKVCPYNKGVQSGYELNVDKGERIMNELIKDPEGYCVAWSYFLADVRLSFPNVSADNIYKKAIEMRGGETKDLGYRIEKKRKYEYKIKIGNKSFLDFIRDYSKLYLKELKFHIKKYKEYLKIIDKRYKRNSKEYDEAKKRKNEILIEIYKHLSDEFKKVSHVKDI